MPRSFRIIVRNRLGLHARPATAFAQVSSGFRCGVRVRRAGEAAWIDGKSVMQMLLLAATAGTSLEVECEGPDAAEAEKAIIALAERQFDED